MKYLRPLRDKDYPCTHLFHHPPGDVVYKEGVYEHTCPGCGYTRLITVKNKGRLDTLNL